MLALAPGAFIYARAVARARAARETAMRPQSVPSIRRPLMSFAGMATSGGLTRNWRSRARFIRRQRSTHRREAMDADQEGKKIVAENQAIRESMLDLMFSWRPHRNPAQRQQHRIRRAASLPDQARLTMSAARQSIS